MWSVKNVFFDVETTGLRPGQICQLSFIVENEWKIEQAKNYFFTVDTMEEGAQKVHGMSKEWLADKSGGLTFKDIYKEVHQVFKEGRIIAHNVKFDEMFISMELWRVGISFRPADRQCTMEFLKDVIKIPARGRRQGKYKRPSLSEVVNYFDIDTNKIMAYSQQLFGAGDVGFHDSRFDTTAIYVATNIYREKQSGGTEWQKTFCR